MQGLPRARRGTHVNGASASVRVSSAQRWRNKGDEQMATLGASVEFATNAEPRCACVLLLDTSISMSGTPIESLNEGLRVFAEDIQGDYLAKQRAEIAIVTFGDGVQTVQEFVIAGDFHPPALVAEGNNTPMGAGINVAIDLLERRKDEYKRNGVMYYRPWVFMITDGAPTDDWSGAAERVKEEESAGGLAFFAVGVAGGDMDTLARISVRSPIRLDGLKFKELFLWLSESQRRVSGTRPGEQAPLPEVEGWSAV